MPHGDHRFDPAARAVVDALVRSIRAGRRISLPNVIRMYRRLRGHPTEAELRRIERVYHQR